MDTVVIIPIPVNKETYDSMCIHLDDIPSWKWWLRYLICSLLAGGGFFWWSMLRNEYWILNASFAFVTGVLIGGLINLILDMIWNID